MCIDELKLLQAQNEALKKQCASLQKELRQVEHDYEMLDACIEVEQCFKNSAATVLTDSEIIELIRAYIKEHKENQELYKFIKFLRSKTS
jgi:hypothetical protein